MSSDDDLLTVSEVADILRFDRKTVGRWIKIGVLEAVDLAESGGTYHIYRVKRRDISKLIEGGKSEENAVGQ